MPNLQFDVRELQELKKQFDPKDVETALKRAVNDAARKAATTISSTTRERYTVSARDIKKHLTISRYQNDVDRAVLHTGKRLPLAQFKPTTLWVDVASGRMVRPAKKKGAKNKPRLRVDRRKGVKVKVRKGESPKLVQGGWLAKNQIFRRKDKGDNRSDPIMRFGPSIPEMVDNPEVIEAAQQRVRDELPKEFSRSLDYILSKKAGLV